MSSTPETKLKELIEKFQISDLNKNTAQSSHCIHLIEAYENLKQLRNFEYQYHLAVVDALEKKIKELENPTTKEKDEQKE